MDKTEIIKKVGIKNNLNYFLIFPYNCLLVCTGKAVQKLFTFLSDIVIYSFSDLHSIFRKTIFFKCVVYLCNRSKLRKSNLSTVHIE